MYRALEYVHFNDQKVRLNYQEVSKIKTKRYSNRLMKEWRKVDRKNIYIIEKILRKNKKYLSREQVGELVFVPWLVIHHSPLNIRQKYLKLLIDGVKCGDILRSNIALTIDKNKVDSHQMQIYGTQYYIRNDKKYFYAIWNETEVNSRRQTM